MKQMRSSWRYNESLELIPGMKLRFFSIAMALLSLILAVGLVGGLPSLSTGWILMALALSVGVASQAAITGRYDFENLEKFLSSTVAWARPKFFHPSRVFSGFVIEKEENKTSSQKNSTAKDKDEKITLYRRNREVIGFRITRNLHTDYQLESFLTALLDNLPLGCEVQCLPVFEKDRSVHRPCLANKGVTTSQYYVFGVFNPAALGVNRFRQHFLTLCERVGERLSIEEIKGLFERHLNSAVKPTGGLEPVFRFGVSLQNGKTGRPLASVGSPDASVLVLSLARLPRLVGSQMRDLYAAVGRSEAIVSIQYKRITGVDLKNLFLGVLSTFLKFWGKEEKQKDGVDRHARNLAAQVVIAIQGPASQLEEWYEAFEERLAKLPDDERPVFARENAFLKESLLSLYPGSGVFVPLRRLFLVNTVEASLYAPLPVAKESMEHPLLLLRTQQNTVFPFRQVFESPLYIVGPPKKGKTVLLSLMLLSHMQTRHMPVASFVLDAGGGFQWMLDLPGVVAFLLDEDDRDSFKPLPDWPLRLLFSFGEKGRMEAIEWVCDLMKVPEGESIFREKVAEAITAMWEYEQYRLEVLFIALSEQLAALEKKQGQNFPEDHRYRNYLSSLRKFTGRGAGEYGAIFDPEKPRKPDYSTARHFYFCRTNATPSKKSVDLHQAFFSLAASVMYLTETRFGPRGAQPSNLALILDEAKWFVTFFPLRLWRDVNSQARKQTRSFAFGTQGITDAKLSDDHDPYTLLSSFRRFLITDELDDWNTLVHALGVAGRENNPEIQDFLARIQRALLTVGELRKDPKEKPWIYIDEHMGVQIVWADLEPEEHWAMATHGGSQTIRKRALESGLPYWDVARKLASVFPTPPEQTPSEAFLQRLYDRVFFNTASESQRSDA